MNKEDLEKLADLRLQEREIKDKIDEIYPGIIAGLVDVEEGTIIEIPQGTFTVSQRRSWEYPEPVEALELEYKKAKKLAEQTGEATYVTKPSITFKEIIK